LVIERILLNEALESVTLTAYIQTNAINLVAASQLESDTQNGLNRPAVIICPGGGYLSLAEDEAEYVALQFLAKGYQSFVLNYSIGAPYASFPAPFLDLAAAVICVRERADRYAINPNQISVLGLSNGGHVASILGTLWQTSIFPDKLARPDAMLLGFPLFDLADFETKLLEKNPMYTHFIEMMATATLGTKSFLVSEASIWNSIDAISEHTIPTFIWSYMTDEMVGQSQIDAFTTALKANHIQYESLILTDGQHGAVISKTNSGWLESAVQWLETLYNTK
jgi:acetyl esterase/lipase